ncbi:GtrA family protein [Pseudomonas sp. NPDC090203]|uniref:GtrA family protein n=1 Tax=Pseudomonas sp. NPDC090203 TaxID=3364477 RepID=UPI00380F4A4B
MDKTTFKASLKRWAYFLVGGGLNTALTYVIYLMLNLIVSYQVAYAIAYACGIVFSYLFNSAIVFKITQSWKSFLLYPLVYLAQYIVAAWSLNVLVARVHLDERIAPLAVIVLLIPVTYLLSKLVLSRSHLPETPTDSRSHDN